MKLPFLPTDLNGQLLDMASLLSTSNLFGECRGVESLNIVAYLFGYEDYLELKSSTVH